MNTATALSLLLMPVAGIVLAMIAIRAVKKDVQEEDRRHARDARKSASA